MIRVKLLGDPADLAELIEWCKAGGGPTFEVEELGINMAIVRIQGRALTGLEIEAEAFDIAVERL